MGLLHRIIYGKEPAKMVIKKKAHALTILCVVWSLFSLLGVLLFRDGRTGRDEAGVYIAIGIWTLHLTFLAVTVWLWIKEKPKEVEVVTTSEDIQF